MSLFLKIEQVKFSGNDITLYFQPFILSISNPFSEGVTVNNITNSRNFQKKSMWKNNSNMNFYKNYNKYGNKNKNYSVTRYVGNINSSSNTSNNDGGNFNGYKGESNEFYFVSDLMINNFKVEINETKILSSSKLIF